MWSAGFGSECREIEPQLSVDPAGNVVVIGLGGSSQFCVERDVLVAKWSPSGAPQWTRSFGNYAYQKANAIATDGDGNILVAGAFDGSPLDFGGGPLSGTGFLVKLDANGNHIWSRGFEGLTHGLDSVASSASGDVFISGRFNQTIDVGGGPLVPDPATSLPSIMNVFLAKFDAAAAHVWSSKWGEPEAYSQGVMALSSDGSVVLAGVHLDQPTFATASGFLTSLDGGGVERWRRVLVPSDGAVNPVDVAVGDDDAIALGGFFTGIADFGSGPLDPEGGAMWVALYDGSGVLRWARRFGSGSSNRLVSSVDIDSTGNVIVAGAFSGSADFGGGVLSSEPFEWDPFIAKLDVCGNHLWTKSLGATDANDWWPRARLMPSRDIAVVGLLSARSEPQGVDLGGGALHADDELDFFVARFAP